MVSVHFLFGKCTDTMFRCHFLRIIFPTKLVPVGRLPDRTRPQGTRIAVARRAGLPGGGKKFGKKWRNGANCSSPNAQDYAMNRCSRPSRQGLAGTALDPSWKAPLMVRALTPASFPPASRRRLAPPIGNGENGAPDPGGVRYQTVGTAALGGRTRNP